MSRVCHLNKRRRKGRLLTEDLCVLAGEGDVELSVLSSSGGRFHQFYRHGVSRNLLCERGEGWSVGIFHEPCMAKRRCRCGGSVGVVDSE